MQNGLESLSVWENFITWPETKMLFIYLFDPQYHVILVLLIHTRVALKPIIVDLGVISFIWDWEDPHRKMVEK